MSRRVAMVLAAVALGSAGCGENPALRLAVTPERAAPGEPLRVVVESTVAAVGPVELLDGAGTVLASGHCELERGWCELWLLPSAPEVAADLLVRTRAYRRFGSRWRTLAVPLDVGRPLIHPSYLDGVYPPERTLAGQSFRWTTGCALAELEDPGGQALVHLEYQCATTGQTVTVELGQEVASELPCDRLDRQRVRLRIPRSAWAGLPFLPVQIEVSPMLRPVEEGVSADARELGIRIYDFLVTLAANGGGVGRARGRLGWPVAGGERSLLRGAGG